MPSRIVSPLSRGIVLWLLGCCASAPLVDAQSAADTRREEPSDASTPERVSDAGVGADPSSAGEANPDTGAPPATDLTAEGDLYAESDPYEESAAPSDTAPGASSEEPWASAGDPWASTSAQAATSSSPEEDRRTATASLRFVLSGGAVHLVDTPINPDNRIFRVPERSLKLEARPILTAEFNRLSMRVKPRAMGEWQPGIQGKDFSARTYLLEWSGTLKATSRLNFVVGKENLQWGPSLLASPSNDPFVHVRPLNPIAEVVGSYFARVVLVLSPEWTASLIANFLEGELQDLTTPFERRYAAKVDYSGKKVQWSALVFYGRDTSWQLGGYGHWVPSDPVLVYADFRADAKNRAQYPVLDAGPLGLTLEDTGGKWDPAVSALGGFAYTFEKNVTLIMEYLYASAGYDDDQAAQLFTLQKRLARASSTDDPSLAAMGPASYPDPQLRFLRRHYLFPQLRYQWADGDGQLTMWGNLNVDDLTSSAIVSFEQALTENLTLSAFGIANFGKRTGELRSALNAAGLLALTYSL